MYALTQNLQFTFRRLRRTPAFTLTVVLTLALGIGATTAIFSLVEGVLLRPLPFQDATGLFYWEIIWEAGQACPLGLAKSKRTHSRPERFPLWAAISRHRLSFLEAHSQKQINAARLNSQCFWRSAFSPSSAVFFSAQEDHARQPVAVISYALWD